VCIRMMCALSFTKHGFRAEFLKEEYEYSKSTLFTQKYYDRITDVAGTA